MTLEERLEKAFTGIRFLPGSKIEEARQRQRVLVQVPVMARLSREGTVTLGDVYSHCIALGGIGLPGGPALKVSILAFDAKGGVSAVACAPKKKGVHAEGAKRLAKIEKRLRKIKTTDDLEALYRKASGKQRPGETLVDLALSHWENTPKSTILRMRESWIETMVSGRTALYLAMDRRDTDKPARPTDPITSMQKLLETRAGGVFQVQALVTKTKPMKKYIESLEEPTRIIWVYRRMIRS
ncbi:MAG: hypothetical protein JRG91_10820 [Deltaproteobacteria bacterium]|nr:hypothetical protein [Deltaproteobacteria bacterium]